MIIKIPIIIGTYVGGSENTKPLKVYDKYRNCCSLPKKTRSSLFWNSIHKVYLMLNILYTKMILSSDILINCCEFIILNIPTKNAPKTFISCVNRYNI